MLNNITLVARSPPAPYPVVTPLAVKPLEAATTPLWPRPDAAAGTYAFHLVYTTSAYLASAKGPRSHRWCGSIIGD